MEVVVTTYGIKARHYSRQAWIAMGKAREFKRLAKFEPYWDQDGINMSIRHCVQTARMSMGVAVMYRQIEGRL